MKFKMLCTMNSTLLCISGLLCVVMPAKLLASYDVRLAPMGLVIYQFWGVALIGLGMLVWFARNIRESALQRRFAFALFMTNGLSCVIAVRGQYAGANTFGWSTVALFFFFALAFGTFMVIQSTSRGNQH